jgi:crossover junction endodeoxyribonuclease RusA
MTEITLPWPDKVLWPNRPAHWSKVARARKSQKHAAYYLAQPLGRMTGPVNIHLTFCPPDKRRRDIDNMLASCKGHLDGISLAIGVDDSEFRISVERGEVVRGGAVVVRVEP